LYTKFTTKHVQIFVIKFPLCTIKILTKLGKKSILINILDIYDMNTIDKSRFTYVHNRLFVQNTNQLNI